MRMITWIATFRNVYAQIPANTKTSTIPVSYTHLDVYKRQGQGSTHKILFVMRNAKR